MIGPGRDWPRLSGLRREVVVSLQGRGQMRSHVSSVCCVNERETERAVAAAAAVQCGTVSFCFYQHQQLAAAPMPILFGCISDGNSPLTPPITHAFPLPLNNPLCTSVDYYRLVN